MAPKPTPTTPAPAVNQPEAPTPAPAQPEPENPYKAFTKAQLEGLTLEAFDKADEAKQLAFVDDNVRREIRLVIYHREMLLKQAESRVPRAVQAIGYVADLADHNPSDKQKTMIMAEMETAWGKLIDRFSGKPKEKEKGFSLRETV